MKRAWALLRKTDGKEWVDHGLDKLIHDQPTLYHDDKMIADTGWFMETPVQLWGSPRCSLVLFGLWAHCWCVEWLYFPVCESGQYDGIMCLNHLSFSLIPDSTCKAAPYPWWTFKQLVNRIGIVRLLRCCHNLFLCGCSMHIIHIEVGQCGCCAIVKQCGDTVMVQRDLHNHGLTYAKQPNQK